MVPWENYLVGEPMSAEAILEVIRRRRSVRRYRPDPVDRETVDRLLDAARWAPSAGNLQPWFFYVVTEARLKRELAAAALRQSFVAEAPVCIVVCAEPERSARIYGTRGRTLYCLQDTAAAVQNILLAAQALGLGACWVGAFDEERVCACLDLPETLRPVAIIPLGYPARETEPRPGRRELKEIVLYR